MKTKLMLVSVALCSAVAFAAPPGGEKGKWSKEDREEFREERMEARENKARLLYLVAISEALELSDAEALKLGDKLKGFEEKRRPLRQQMGDAMRSLRDAADGDQAALGQVDANVQRVLDGRAQMAQLDKELFNSLAQGLTPQKKARLALVLGRLSHEMKGGGKKGRHHGRK